MDTLSIETEMALHLVRARMELKRINYKSMLRSNKVKDKKEEESLMAGYKKAQKDLDEVLVSIAEM